MEENNEKIVQNEVKENVNSNINKQKKNNNGKTIALLVIVLILVLAIGIGGGLLLSGKGNVNNNENTTKAQENSQEENKSSKKIDESKDWVYDAEYLKENKKIYSDSNKTEEYAVNSDKDLVVPYININSEYAKTVNDNIKSLYDDYYSKYGTEITTPYSNEYKCYNHYELKYDSYINDNILSVIITLHEGQTVVDGGTGGGTATTYTYNFNLDTLNEATVNEMAIKCGFSSEYEVSSKIKEWEEKQRNILVKANYADIFNGVDNGKFFIDGNGKLNFLYRTSTSGSFEHMQPIEKDKEIELFYTEEDADAQIRLNEELLQNQTSGKNENTSSNSNNSTYAKEYIKVIDEIKSEYPNDNITCDLIYFNNDNIPDLVIGISGYWVSLYIYENGTVYNPIDDWSYGMMGNTGYSYLENKAIVLNHNSDYAGAISTDSILVLNSKKEFDVLSYTGEGASVESTDSRYEEIQEELARVEGYYYNDKKISEQEYNNKLKEFSIDFNANGAAKVLDGSRTIAEVEEQLQ